MRLSQYFLPTLKENPIDASIISHQLMIRAGMIRQTTSGIYTWLPLGLKVLQKVEKIIRDEMAKINALEVLMPTIQPAELWQESGRYNAYGKEMLRVKDRHDREMLYGPTHEEIITDIFRKNIVSYKDLPKNLYQIQWKFRDEIRPRFGVMRGREFLMKDSYSFDINEEQAKKTYDIMYQTYFKIFKNMGLNAIAVRADTGAIGGDLSHEFHILAGNGESEIFYDQKLDQILAQDDFDIEEAQKLYAMADEMHKSDQCPVNSSHLSSKRGIEVGHIFNFGLKYSKSMNASVMGDDGKPIYPNMGSYGIGVSRVVAAAIEASHDQNGIIWPKEIAPFQIHLINLACANQECQKEADQIYAKLVQNNIEVIYDDSSAQIGQKLSIADLIGCPTQVIIGPKIMAQGKAEIKNRQTGEKQQVGLDVLMPKIAS